MPNPPESVDGRRPDKDDGVHHHLNVRCWRSRELFGDGKEVLIEHDGEVYRLRITRNRKLILTK